MKAILFAVLAGLCWGIGELCTKSVLHSKQVGPLAAIAVRSTVALPLLWIAFWVAAYGVKASTEPPAFLSAQPAVLSKLILGSGIVAGAAAMIFFYTALSLGEISRVKPIAFTIAPATAVLLGWLILGESMDLRKAAGVILILGGVLLLTGKAPVAA